MNFVSRPPLTEYVGTTIIFRLGVLPDGFALFEGVIFPRPGMLGADVVVIATVALVALINVVDVDSLLCC